MSPASWRTRPKSETAIARRLRKASTDAERVLWRCLRDRQLCGFKFRRNEPVADYFVDFLCVEACLVVELDGGGHFTPEQQAYDAQRTAVLRERGLTVIRFSNAQVFTELEAVLTSILNELPSP